MSGRLFSVLLCRVSAISPIECRREKIFALCQPSTPMNLSQVEFLAVDVRGLRSVSRRVSWGAGFSPFDSSRRELLVSVEKKFRSILRLLTGFFHGFFFLEAQSGDLFLLVRCACVWWWCVCYAMLGRRSRRWVAHRVGRGVCRV